jgi:hypothetical protein
VVGDSCILKISFKHTTVNYLDAECPTKAAGTHIYENAEISPQNDAYLQIKTCTSTSLVIF